MIHYAMNKKTALTILITLGLIAAIVFIILWKGSDNQPVSPQTASVVQAVEPEDLEIPPIETTPPELFTFNEFPTDTFEYIEVWDSCGPYLGGNPCVSLRKGPGTDFEKIGTVRNGIVLRTSGTVERDGHTWYKIMFDEWLRYPERVEGDRYVAGDYVREFSGVGQQDLSSTTVLNENKVIYVNINSQTMVAYENDAVVFETPISTGKGATPTEPGTYSIYRKTPSRYMQGPLPGSTDEYDLPGTPWNMYFTKEGGVIHGAYWHNSFGRPASHGCINMPLDMARQLYEWADLGTKVIVVSN